MGPVKAKKERLSLTNTPAVQERANKEIIRPLCSGKRVKSTKLKTDKKTPQKVETLKMKRAIEEDECDQPKRKKIVTSADIRKREVEILAKSAKVSEQIATNFINLIEKDEATIPFIARYRKHLVGDLNAEQLRELKAALEKAKAFLARQEFIKKALIKVEKLDRELEGMINSADTLTELEYIYEPFKVKKSSKVERAISFGLLEPTMVILNGLQEIKLKDLVDQRKGLSSIEEVEYHIVVLIANSIAKDPRLLAKVRNLKETERIFIKTKGKPSKDSDDNTFKQYYDFCMEWRRTKAYQILAINRGVSKKLLSMKIDIGSNFRNRAFDFAQALFLNSGFHSPLRSRLFREGFDIGFKKIESLVEKLILDELNAQAEKASLEVFASNLKWLLLSPPARGHTVLAIDPGFSNGCKIAVVEPCGKVLATEVLMLLVRNSCEFSRKHEATLRDLVLANGVSLIGIGNGKGCREVEEYIGRMITSGKFKPADVSFTIVSESGVSVYSCSKEAMEEFPDLSSNLISAVSLARRVQDPLCELVKVDPKHLGVGMYQHDSKQKKLESELAEVVSECVSIVGIDINTASTKLLSHISGLTLKRAEAIVAQRNRRGPFMNREQIKDVKGIGPKTFQQCSGFVRVVPDSIKGWNSNGALFNPLDRTDVHPEFYDAALQVVHSCGLSLGDLGSETFISCIKNWAAKTNLKTKSTELNISEENLKLIIESFSSPLDKDMRLDIGKPIFLKGVKSIHNLAVGQAVTGKVENVTPFGVFVDIGIERSGLIPKKYLNNLGVHLGNRVEVKIMDIDAKNLKTTLYLISVK